MPSRPLSAEFSYTQADINPATMESSTLFSILPSMVQNRLPRLPSLRRSVSMYGNLSGGRYENRNSSDVRYNTESKSSSGLSTPTLDSALVLSGEQNVAQEGFYHLRAEEREQGFSRAQRGFNQEPNESGIRGKFANTGLTLLSSSIHESNSPPENTTSYTSAPISRQLYIDALTYLIRGLPADLSPDEQTIVRSSLPPGIAKPCQVYISSAHTSSKPNCRIHMQQQQAPSLLHRTLASSIIQLFLLAQLLLPYLQALLKIAFQFERQNRISEKVVAGSVNIVDAVGRRGISVGGILWSLGLGDFVAWTVEGVTGGVNEGIREGLIMVGSPNKWEGAGVDLNFR